MTDSKRWIASCILLSSAKCSSLENAPKGSIARAGQGRLYFQPLLKNEQQLPLPFLNTFSIKKTVMDDYLDFETPIAKIEAEIIAAEASNDESAAAAQALRDLRKKMSDTTRDIYDNLSPWQTVQVARHKNRPHTTDYLSLVFEEFVELHGDKLFGDDRAIRAGFATIDGTKVMVMGHQKGRTFKDRTENYFGCAHPEGYRKAMAKMKMAEKYNLPVICFIDTPGAYPGIGAEERGQAQVIAEKHARDVSPKNPNYLRGHRRRRQRRSAWNRSRRSRCRSQERLLLSDQPRRLCWHFVEGCRACGEGC